MVRRAEGWLSGVRRFELKSSFVSTGRVRHLTAGDEVIPVTLLGSAEPILRAPRCLSTY